MFINYIAEKKYKVTFLAAIFSGIIAHGFMLTNKISFHDDIGTLFSVGGGRTSGRWFLEVIYEMLSKSVGKYSMPLWGGGISILFIALMACIIIDILKIDELISCMVAGAIFVTFPVITSTFYFMFNAGCFFFALFLCVLAVWLVEKCNIWIGGIGGIICITLSLGIYQAYFGVGIVLVLFILLRECQINDNPKKIINIIMKHGMVQVLGMVSYIICLKISLRGYSGELTAYQGIDTIGKISVGDIIKRAGYAYSNFGKFISGNTGDVLGGTALNMVVSVLSIAILFNLLYIFIKIKSILIKLIYLGIVLVIPLGMNIIYPMTTETTYIYSLMRYPLVFIWILSLYLLELNKEHAKGIKFKIVKGVILAGTIISFVYFTYIANVAYMKSAFLQEQTISYYTTLITQIKSSDGYKDDYPVVYVGAGNVTDLTITTNDRYKVNILWIVREDLESWINDYAYVEFMRYHCGFSPVIISEAEIEDWSEINQMPTYPDCGSIKIIDEKVIVKLGENSR